MCPSPKRWRAESGETGLLGGMGVVTCSWQVVRLGGAATGQEGASGGCHPPGGGITIIAVWMPVTGQQCAHLPVLEGG